MGGEDEIVRIARRLDKMVAKKNAVSGGGRPPAALLGWGAAPCPGLLSGRRAPSSPFPQDPLLSAALVDPHLSLGARCERSPQTPFWGALFQCRPGHYIVLEQRLPPLKCGFLPQASSPSPIPILCGGVGSTHSQLLGGQPYVPPWVLWEPPIPILSTPAQASGIPRLLLSTPGLTLCCLPGVLLLESILSPSPLSLWESSPAPD